MEQLLARFALDFEKDGFGPDGTGGGAWLPIDEAHLSEYASRVQRCENLLPTTGIDTDVNRTLYNHKTRPTWAPFSENDGIFCKVPATHQTQQLPNFLSREFAERGETPQHLDIDAVARLALAGRSRYLSASSRRSD